MSNNGTISMSIGNKCDIEPLKVGDFPQYSGFPTIIPWTNPWDGIQTWPPPKQPDIQWTYVTSGLPKAEIIMDKNKEKLQYIKGLIESARLMLNPPQEGEEVNLIDGNSLLDKILQVIEE